MTETKTRLVSKALLIVISLVVIAVVALIVTGIHLSNPYLRRRVVEMLGEKFHADVELKEFHVYSVSRECGSRAQDWLFAMKAAPTFRP